MKGVSEKLKTQFVKFAPSETHRANQNTSHHVRFDISPRRKPRRQEKLKHLTEVGNSKANHQNYYEYSVNLHPSGTKVGSYCETPWKVKQDVSQNFPIFPLFPV